MYSATLLVGKWLSLIVQNMVVDHGQIFVLGESGKGYLVTLHDSVKRRPGEMYAVITTGMSIPVVRQDHTSGLVYFGITNGNGEEISDAVDKLGCELQSI